jgi:segregation and condensation protein B
MHTLPSTRPNPLAQTDRTRLPANHPLPAVYSHVDVEGEEPIGEDEHARDPQLALVEAVFFASDEPVTFRKLAGLAGSQGTAEVRKLVRRLRALYDAEGSAFQIQEVAGGLQLLTCPEYHPWLARLCRSTNDLRLSSAARETLAIIAYKQPITRADVEAIRGVQSADVLRQLMERGLIRIAGRHDSLGRPILYGTTRKFLQSYGLKNLNELPQAEQLRPPNKTAPANAGQRGGTP